MITSVHKKIHPQTGIISILINTEHKWLSYQINRLIEKHKIEMSFFDVESIEYMPGQWEEKETETIEYIDMKEDFNPFEYMIYHHQEKDQITLMLLPRTTLLDKPQWINYGIQTNNH